MRRSYLFLPGNNPAILNTGDVFGSDGLIFDLEDAVSIEQKDAARHLVMGVCQRRRTHNQEIVVRLNAVDSPHFLEDVKALLPLDIDVFLLPKATIETISEADKVLSAFEKNSKIPLIALVESPLGVLEAKEIAAHPRVIGLLFGAEDYTQAMQIERTKTAMEIFTARSLIAMSAKAMNKFAIDTPFTDTLDEAGLLADALVAKQLGFVGKACIHPNQIDVVQRVFSPSMEQIRQARRIITAFEEHQAKQIGVFSLDGKMIDKPIYDRAKELLEFAKSAQLWRDEDEE